MVMTRIRLAEFPGDTTAILDIWREFVANSPVSLTFQANEKEFAGLPGKYAPPDGRIILADRAGSIVGCVALRKVSPDICEMKRLYVRPYTRGLGLGYQLVERAIAEARMAGYAEMRLDVMAESEKARRIYRAWGFEAAEPVSFNPSPTASFLGLKLR